MSQAATFRFKLFVAGNAPNSVQAIGNLRALCSKHLKGRFHIEIVDVFRDPKQALKERIFMTPTLIELAPLPVRRIVGTLGETEALLVAMGVAPLAA